jgi:hypothetical protein
MSLENASTTLFDSSDVETGTAANPLRIDPTGTTTQPISGTVTANQGTAAAVASAWPILVTDGTNTAVVTTAAPGAAAAGLVVRVAGSVTTSIAQPSTGTVTSVAVTTVVATALVANTSRLGASFWNDGTARVFLRLSAGATTALFTVRIDNKGFYELSFPAYTGIVTVITSVGTATLLATELT